MKNHLPDCPLKKKDTHQINSGFASNDEQSLQFKICTNHADK